MKTRLLLVDDHEEARTNLARLLLREPALDLVGVAGCVEEAAAFLHRVRPDIVLVDFRRHDRRGQDAFLKLQQLTEAPLVAFTSYMTPDLWAATKEAGAADYLLKHIDAHRLSQEIVRLAQRHGSGERQTSC